MIGCTCNHGYIFIAPKYLVSSGTDFPADLIFGAKKLNIVHIAVQRLARILIAEVRLAMEGVKSHRINSSVL